MRDAGPALSEAGLRWRREVVRLTRGAVRAAAWLIGREPGRYTMEDVLEEIVGDIRDESDQPADDIQRMPDGTLRVRANVDLRRLSAELGVAWDPDSEVATIGGLVTEELERIPARGDAIDWNGYHIEVLRADRRRARMLLVTQTDQSDNNE